MNRDHLFEPKTAALLLGATAGLIIAFIALLYLSGCAPASPEIRKEVQRQIDQSAADNQNSRQIQRNNR
jgi:hypothetical protein